MTKPPHSRKRSNPPSSKPNSYSRHKRLKQGNEGAKAKLNSRPGKAIRLDELAWKEVSMPDRLDDVEGFFGLEEVGNVDVVRDGAVVKFIKFGDTESTSERKEKEDKGSKETVVGDDDWGDDGNEDEIAEEWGGIESSNDEGSEDDHKFKSTTVKNAMHTFPGDHELSRFDFSVLNEDTPEENVALPNWASLNLSSPTLRALARLKFTSPTPIQSAAIPQILSGNCVIGKASTGSGKTLAFGIPILEKYLTTLSPYLHGNKQGPRKLTGLIISPTRELAHQITKHLAEISYYTELKITPITGGLSVQKQQRLLNKGVDVIVATPGRLWEIVSEGQGWVEKLRNVRFLVLDEADRVLEQGHFKEVEQILNLMDAQDGQSSDESEDEEATKGETDVRIKAKRKREKIEAKKQPPAKPRKSSSQRQTLVFSATFNKNLQQKLARRKNKKDWPKGDLLSNQESMEYLLQKLRFASEPVWVDVDPLHSVSQNVKQGIIECGSLEKDLYLFYLLLRYPCRTLIFTNSISSVRRLVPFLNYLFPPSPTTTTTTTSSSTHSQQHMAYQLHSQLPQKSRLRSLERFASSRIAAPILVATDVAARGLDLPKVALVVHYNIPRSADIYVHRAGRTGRITTSTGTSTASQSSPVDGSSVLLCAPGEALAVARLTAKVNPTTTTISQHLFQTIPIDRTLISKLHRRVSLAQKITQAELDRHKLSKEQQWLRDAATELGADFDEEEIMHISGSGRRKGKGLKVNEKEGKGSRGKGKGKGGVEWDDATDGDGDERGVAGGSQYGAAKAEVDRWKWELKNELTKKLSKGGFSVKYLTGGNINLAEHLLKGEGHGEILGEGRRDVLDEMR